MRSGLEQLCAACRLRLPRHGARCPFCGEPTLGPTSKDRLGALRRSRWPLTLSPRFLRWWALVVGGLVVFPAPLLLLAVPLSVLVFGGPQEPSELILSTVIASPGLFLVFAMLGPLAVVASSLPGAILLAMAEVVFRRRTIEVCVDDRPPLPQPSPLEQPLHRLRDVVDHIARRAGSWKAFAATAGVAASVLVALSFVIRDEDMLPWAAAMVGAFGVLVFYFAGSVWVGALHGAIDWMLNDAGLRRTPTERGQRAFDRARVQREAVARWRAEREPRHGVVDTRDHVVAPLSGEPVVAYRLRGSVGRWRVDDVVFADTMTLHLDEGPEMEVRSKDWALLDEPGAPPRQVPRTEALEALFEARGLPSEGAIRLAEVVLRPGDRVSLHADASEELGPAHGYRDGLTVVLTGTPQRPVVVACRGR